MFPAAFANFKLLSLTRSQKRMNPAKNRSMTLSDRFLLTCRTSMRGATSGRFLEAYRNTWRPFPFSIMSRLNDSSPTTKLNQRYRVA